MNRLFVSLPLLIILIGYTAPAHGANNCDTSQCYSAAPRHVFITDQSDTVGFVRFSSLPGITVCQTGADTDVYFRANDPRYKEKLSLITSAHLAGRTIWMYLVPMSATDRRCTFGYVALN